LSGSRPPRPSTAEQAARLTELLTRGDSAGAETLAAEAARHYERARRPRQRLLATGAGAPPDRARLEAYLRDAPTGSPVLNAFLHQFGAGDLVPATVAVPDEHRLAPRMVECARRHLAGMLIAGGDAETGLFFASEIPPITSEHAARMYVRQAAACAESELGAIARDYEEHRGRRNALERDDRLGSAIMAAFAGRLLAYATRLIGSQVREDVRTALSRLTSVNRVPVRHRSVPPQAAPESAGAVSKPKRTAG